MSSERAPRERWRRWLMSSSPVTDDVAEERSVELVAFLALILTFITMFAMLIGAFLAPRYLIARLPVLMALIAWYLLVFALNRTRYHRVAAFLFCLQPLWANFSVGLISPDDPAWFGFIPIAAILGSGLLRFRPALVIAALGVAGTAAVVLARLPDYGATRAVVLVACVAIVSSVVLGIAQFRARVERGRLAEVERLAQQLAATERLESIGRLAGGIAHDFNNLLTVILASTDLARRGRGGPELLDAVIDAAQSAAGLTKQLLVFTRNRVGATTVLRLDELVDGLGPLLRRLLPATITLETELRSEWLVEADVSQLQQVLLNLAVNARDAMPDGGHIRIAIAELSAATGDQVQLEVIDNGHGMDVATRRHALEPFFSTKPLGQGTGLGLATVHGIIRQSGGTIALASEPGAGTTVTIVLPRSQGKATPALPLRGPSSIRRTTGVVLVVEDDPLVRGAIERILRDLGLQVVIAASAAEVPRAMAEAPGPIDLLVSDVVLPGKSGLTLVAELRAKLPGLPAVLMSGYSEDDVAAVAGRADTRFVAKPFKTEILAGAVSDLLAIQAPRSPAE